MERRSRRLKAKLDNSSSEISQSDNESQIKQRKQKTSKKSRVIKTSSEEDSSASDAKYEGSENSDSACGEKAISEYERQVLQNIEDRKKMFELLKLGEAKEQLAEVLSTEKIDSVKASQRGFKRKKELPPTEPLRRSLRTLKKAPEVLGQINSEVEKQILLKRTGPITLNKAYANQEEVEESTKFMEETVPLLEMEGGIDKLPRDIQEFLSTMKSLTISEDGVAKVVKSRIYSLTWHPSSSKLLLAAGDKVGSIGFWDIDRRDDKHQGVRVYDVHSAPVNCLSFDKFTPTNLISTSYDGSVRKLDFHTNIFHEVYSIPDSKGHTWTAYHAQKDASTLLVSQSDGHVTVLDMRVAPGKVQQCIQCFEKSVRTLSLHPQEDHLFLACNRYGEAGMFDLRHTYSRRQSVPVMSFEKCDKGIHGAFFSPLTGSYALTTSMDHTLKVFDVAKKHGEATCITRISHNNFTGRWLTPFKAVWHPSREDIAVVGSMEHPRRIELFGIPSGELLHNFKGENLSSICSINIFHPTVAILAGGNSSGRVHIFRSQ